MLKTLFNPLVALRGRFGGGKAIAIEPVKREPAKRVGEAPAIAAQGQLNPFVEARREWNERYGDYIRQAHNWRVMAIISGCVALIAVIGVAYIGAQNKIIPYVVEVDKLGQATAVARADRPTTVDPRIIKAYLARFAADWRTVTVDTQAQKSAIDRVYAMLPSNSIALGKMNDFFKAHNPFTTSSKRSVAIAVTNLLPISDKTWQVEWREVTRDGRGEVLGNVRMKASIIVGITPPTDESLILINPLGVYITDLNWSQQL